MEKGYQEIICRTNLSPRRYIVLQLRIEADKTLSIEKQQPSTVAMTPASSHQDEFFGLQSTILSSQRRTAFRSFPPVTFMTTESSITTTTHIHPRRASDREQRLEFLFEILEEAIKLSNELIDDLRSLESPSEEFANSLSNENPRLHGSQ